MTLQRKLEIANFRNLGIGKVENLELNADATKGDLIILVGENNSGKSNVLGALQAFGDKSISEDDKPNFIDEDKEPSLRLVHSSKKLIDSYFRQLDESFKDKVFNIVFSENSLETVAKKEKMSTEEYITQLKNLLKSSSVLCLFDLDKDKENPREEIRLILKDKNLMLLCSAESNTGKSIKCFRTMPFGNLSEVKNYDKAFVANCHFTINSNNSKTLGNGVNLISFLKDDFKKSKIPINPLYEELDTSIIDKKASIKALQDKISYMKVFVNDSKFGKKALNQLNELEKLSEDFLPASLQETTQGTIYLQETTTLQGATPPPPTSLN
ncbi:hypothetical protein [Campylobacter troglodytis]|uniref:hypothetical protein n=1 Tax=Campylobacter troglodytis TaxID=654363 RepID=UPI00115926CA|nr:hypothetical protein [Campylobacter troglodytis]TQR61618.1 hypothetical protein DMC01_00155 [Campylobacter troglodytis]